MIEKISVTNFKSHAHTEIELGRVTALVGPNGCGKTSLLQAILLVDQLNHSGFDAGLFESHISKGQKQLCITVAGNQAAKWQFTFNYGEANSPFVYSYGDKTWPDEDSSSVSKVRVGELRKNVFKSLGRITYFKGIANLISKASYSAEQQPSISQDGSGLASTLVFLMTYKRDIYPQLESALTTIVPFIKRIRARPAILTLKEKKIFSVNDAQVPYEEERQVTGQELIFDTTGSEEISAQAMSEGTLLTLGLLTLLYSSPESTKLFLLDDVEQGLHPLAQRRLMNLLKEFAERHDCQILLTTHSPYIVDELEAKDIWVMATDKEGISHCKRLSDHPDIGYALSVLTTGEIWGAEGEEWVLNGSSPTETETANA
jgi:ABC-type Mn2+/Zn2+ transport system ATPase subunit